MLDLSKLPVQATLGILSRYAAARVNPYTALVGEVLCQGFRLTAVGRKKLETAVGNLKAVRSLGNTLEFGFGIEDVVRTMAQTERGCVCLALCAALKECYSDDIAVEVLLEMARLVSVEGQYMPSSRSWKDLLSACAGTLSASKFPYLAEHLMQLSDDKQRLGAFQRLDASPKSFRTCSRPDSIAEALFSLAQISRGEMQAIKIYGGPDAGWLAALAEWMLDLKIEIRNLDGTLYYTHGDTENTQVTIIMRKRGDEISHNMLESEKTFVLNDLNQIFEKEGKSPDAVVVSGRLEWKHALSSAFLSDFKNLMTISQTLGDCIGSAARLFKGLAQGDEAFPSLSRLACCSYSDDSYGAQFVLNTIKWLPELRGLKDTMLKSVEHDLASARRQYEECISRIRSHCNCVTCQSRTTGHDTFTQEDEDDVPMTPAPEDDGGLDLPVGSEPEQDHESTNDWDPDRFCEVIITETILVLSRVLSNVLLVDKNLLPTRSGLEVTYGRQLTNRLSAPFGRSVLQEIGPIAFCLDFNNDFAFATRDSNEEAVEIRLHTALELFAGRGLPPTTSNYSALCVNGICAFLDIISETSSGYAEVESASMIHILPGRITYDKKSYSMVIDRFQPVDPPETDFTNTRSFIHARGSLLENRLTIRETYTGLEAWIEIECRPDLDGRKPEKVRAGPSKLAMWLTSRRGLVCCKRPPSRASRTTEGSLGFKHECAWSNTIALREVQDAVHEQNTIHLHGKAIDVLKFNDTSSAIAAVASTVSLDPKYSIFIIDSECLSCSIRSVLAVDRSERTDFCLFRLPQ